MYLVLLYLQMWNIFRIPDGQVSGDENSCNQSKDNAAPIQCQGHLECKCSQEQRQNNI